jgi:hypothetical protein
MIIRTFSGSSVECVAVLAIAVCAVQFAAASSHVAPVWQGQWVNHGIASTGRTYSCGDSVETAPGVWSVFVFSGRDGALQDIPDFFRVDFAAEGANMSVTDLSGQAGQPAARHGHSCGFHGGKFYVLGGRITSAGSNYRSEVHEYTVSAPSWRTPSTALPSGRYEMAHAVYDGAILLFGGFNSGGRLADLLSWRDPATGSVAACTQTPYTPTARNSPRMVRAGGPLSTRFILFGGYDVQYRNDLHQLQFNTGTNTGTWTLLSDGQGGGTVSVGPFPDGCNGHFAVYVEATSMLWIGLGSDGVPPNGANDVWRFDDLESAWHKTATVDGPSGSMTAVATRINPGGAGERLFLFSGWETLSPDKVTNATYSLALAPGGAPIPAANISRETLPVGLSQGRGELAAAGLLDVAIAAGGKRQETPAATSNVVDIFQNGARVKTATLSSARYNLAAAASPTQNRFLVGGGWIFPGGSNSAAVESIDYNVDGALMSVVPRGNLLSVARGHLCASAIDDTIIFAGGYVLGGSLPEFMHTRVAARRGKTQSLSLRFLFAS